MRDLNFWIELSDFFKIFGDSTRLRILDTLLDGEKCVTEISEILEISQSAVSHQLRTLRNSNMVLARKEGQLVYYKIADDHIQTILEYASCHIGEEVKNETFAS